MLPFKGDRWMKNSAVDRLQQVFSEFREPFRYFGNLSYLYFYIIGVFIVFLFLPFLIVLVSRRVLFIEELYFDIFVL